MTQLVSDTVMLDYSLPIDNLQLEQTLENQFGEVIRWAIVDITQTKIKVCVTYQKD